PHRAASSEAQSLWGLVWGQGQIRSWFRHCGCRRTPPWGIFTGSVPGIACQKWSLNSWWFCHKGCFGAYLSQAQPEDTSTCDNPLTNPEVHGSSLIHQDIYIGRLRMGSQGRKGNCLSPWRSCNWTTHPDPLMMQRRILSLRLLGLLGHTAWPEGTHSVRS